MEVESRSSKTPFRLGTSSSNLTFKQFNVYGDGLRSASYIPSILSIMPKIQI